MKTKTRSASLFLTLFFSFLLPGAGLCFYNPTTGKWLSRDPLGEAPANSLYAFAQNNPQAVIDPYGLYDFQIVCDKAADLDRRIHKLKSNTGDQFKAVFMSLQLCILNKLCKGACCNSEADANWLNALINTFMTQFTDALDGRYYAGNQQWKAVLGRADTLKPITPTPEDMKYLSMGVPAGGTALSLYMGTALADRATGVNLAREMALTHINQDLAQALRQNGTGPDTEWKCIGGVVGECQKNFFSRLEQLVGKLLPKDRFDVPFIRDQMRERVKLELGQPTKP